mgnify:CR=1 FL=1
MKDIEKLPKNIQLQQIVFWISELSLNSDRITGLQITGNNLVSISTSKNRNLSTYLLLENRLEKKDGYLLFIDPNQAIEYLRLCIEREINRNERINSVLKERLKNLKTT